MSDSRPKQALADTKDVKSTPNTEGKAGVPVSYELYLLPTVDPTQKPPQPLVNAVVLCPEGKDEYSTYFVRNGQWLTEKNAIKKVEKQKYSLDTVKTEGLLEKNKINAKALERALALGKIPTFANLPPDILTDTIFSQLNSRESAKLPRLSQSLHASFQSTVEASTLLKYVAHGLQEEAEKLLLKVQFQDSKEIHKDSSNSHLLRLLRAKNPVRDASGREFKEPLTAFQYAYWARDRHMLRMLNKYIPKEEQAAQLKELRDKKLPYEVVLLSLREKQKFQPRQFAMLSAAFNHRPFLVKQGGNISVYGYNFLKKTWELTPLKADLFKSLAFPPAFATGNYALHLCRTAPTAKTLAQLVPGNNSAYVLVQSAPGIKPSAFYFVDRSSATPVLTQLHFPGPNNMDLLTSGLYPNARDHKPYLPIARLSPPALATITASTGHPLPIVNNTQLSEAMYKELANGHTQGTEHGLHYDFNALLETYEVYSTMRLAGMWTSTQARDYWSTVVGKAQDGIPAQVRDEFCRLDRSFDPTPTFTEESLPRKGKLGSNMQLPFYTQEGSRLGLDYAVHRGEWEYAVCSNGDPNILGTYEFDPDKRALKALDEVSREFVSTLSQELLQPTPPAATTDPSPKRG